MNISQGMVEFLRKQHPEGSRIKLNNMPDDPRPIPAGSTGILDHIDDIGTFHVKWDNGRTLGLVPGVDQFEIQPPELKLLKLYMPMTVSRQATSYEYEEDHDINDDYIEVSTSEAISHVAAIQSALMQERADYTSPGFLERGMMEYYGDDDSVNRKVQCYHFNAEVRDGKLWGVAECLIRQDLTPEELSKLKDEISGQASDGFGEGFEQTEIEDGSHTIYAHLWSFDPSWTIKTEAELFPEWLKDLPDTCFSTLESTGEVIMLQKGEMGYLKTRLETANAAEAADLADHYNERLGVSKAQASAMKIGSMMGWHVPAANPSLYDENGRLKTERREEGEKEQPLSARLASATSRAAAQAENDDIAKPTELQL